MCPVLLAQRSRFDTAVENQTMGQTNSTGVSDELRSNEFQQIISLGLMEMV